MSEGGKDPVAARLGMWLFLFSELLLFGALFLLYAVSLKRYPADFHHAAKEMSILFGAGNTALLITSSLFMALSVSEMKKGSKVRSRWLLLGVILLACIFLVNKYMEWYEKIHHGLYPNAPELLLRPAGEIIFYNLYYIMTGIHGLHVGIGIAVFTAVWFLIHRDRIHSGRLEILENCGLYWHLVDIIWIFLFPLFYLIT